MSTPTTDLTQKAEPVLSVSDTPNDGAHEEAATADDWRSHVSKYSKKAKYPFELGDTVYIVRPDWRAPVGPFYISKALSNYKFELVRISDDAPYSEAMEGKLLCRDPYRPEI